ncbi:AAA family ATPase [Methylocapsa polymorpha]|uniref:AAA family ATPase n=1 Tax=Methylocapsa polymorpha TaxID=3080828 RepID=A0ABZ0HNJ4_9HYPH|nr:AAA family ATPase [Methylocapsa sp. RX1]
MLVIFGGLPGVGKTTIARALAVRLKAVYLRIDTIEQAIRSSDVLAADADMGPTGYIVAYHLAADNLRMGRSVVADSVNSMALTRDAYKAVAEREAVNFLEVEVICSDKTEHRKRIETRESDIAGLALPTWRSIVAAPYESWGRPHLVLDTASLTARESLEIIIGALSSPNLRTPEFGDPGAH